ncbi:hypothetical protein JVU11DRAFT_1836 [Chiua virens]|nr:hypothetical protein JVU11DRAFT_1836 [Chiua virens]
MGLWTLVLKPLLHNLSFLHRLLVFSLASGQDRSPLQIVVRRLCLDISFIMVVVGVLRTALETIGDEAKGSWSLLWSCSGAPSWEEGNPWRKISAAVTPACYYLIRLYRVSYSSMTGGIYYQILGEDNGTMVHFFDSYTLVRRLAAQDMSTTQRIQSPP